MSARSKYKFGALVSVRNEEPWMHRCLDMIKDHVDVISVTRGLTSWTNDFKTLDKTDEIVKSHSLYREKRIIYQEVEQPESDEFQRNVCLQPLKDAGCDFVFIIDPDEFWRIEDLYHLFEWVADAGPDKVGQLYCYAHAYWKGFGYRCGTEHFGPIMVACRKETSFDYIRAVNQDPGHTIELCLHHMTAVKTDAGMREKILGWSHSHEVVENWLERKWDAWNDNRGLRDLHPVSPGLWPSTVEVNKTKELPAILFDHPWFLKDVVA